MAKGKRDIFIVPLFIPTQGCPFRCIYCKQESITGVKRPIPLKEMEEILSKAINSKGFYSATQREIAFFGGTFTGLDHEDMNQLLYMAKPFIERGYFHNIRISTRPDLIQKDTLKFLKKAHVKTIEIGVQSFNDMVLETCLRGYNRETVLNKAELIKEKGFLLGIQLMVGLPKEREDTFMEGVKIAISLRPAFVRLYPTIVLKGTQLAGLYHKGKYRPLTLEEAIGLCSWAICQFEERGIRVIRVGLHNLRSLKEEILAGPFHESFGDLSRSVATLYRAFREGSLFDPTSRPNRVKIPISKAHVVYGHGKEALRIFLKRLGAGAYEIKKTGDHIEVRFEL